MITLILNKLTPMDQFLIQIKYKLNIEFHKFHTIQLEFKAKLYQL